MKTKNSFIPSSLHPLIPFFLLLFIPSSLHSQQITPSVWMSSGNVGTMSNGNQYSWSMGESFTATLPSSTLTFTQGFQQLFNVLGCTDPTAFNYNANANQDDGSCIPMLTCNITAPTTTLCAGESVTLSMNTTGGGSGLNALPANLQQGLVAYYPFNGNANDASGNGNNGTVNGATLTADRFGNPNGAYSFDGVDDYISMNGISLPYGNSDRTISCFYQKLNNSSPWSHTVVSYGSPITSRAVMLAVGNNNYLAIQGWADDIGIPIASTNAWEHFVFSLEGGLGKAYVNGNLVATQNVSNWNTEYLSFIIGCRVDLLNSFLYGSVDDCMVYNRALSPSEIQQLYTGQFYNWSNGATTSTNTVSPTASTTCSCTVTQGAQTCTASLDLTVNPVVSNTVNASIIQGQSYNLGTQNLTTSGTYTEVFTSAAGCDSTVTLNLTVEPLLTCNITAPTTTLCAGESVTLSMIAVGGKLNGVDPPIISGYASPVFWQGHYYYFSNSMMSWNQAHSDAINAGGYLAIFDNEDEKNFIFTQMPGAVWTGLSQKSIYPTYSEPSGGWLWDNGTTFNPNWWDGIQPDECSNCCTPIEPQNFGAFAGNGYFDDLCPSYPIFSLIEWVPQQNQLSSLNWSNDFPLASQTIYPNIGGTYYCTVLSGLQSCTDSILINVNPQLTFYLDADGDGFGDVNAPQSACVQPAGTVTNSTDCNDNNAVLNSISVEICNNFDDDCDGNVDNGLSFVNYYNDLDGDGFGAGTPSHLCADPGAGYANNNTDCNDNNVLVNPGAVEICGNAVDEDCSGSANACATSGTPANPIPSINIAQYGTGTQNNTVVNLATGADDIESSGTGWAKWYQFTAQSNAVRIGLRGSLLVNDDNRIMLFNNINTLGSAWIPLNEENAVDPNNMGTATDAGNEVLLYDQLTVGNVYYVCVQNINNSPGSVQLSIGFLYGSQPDVGAYTNYTNVYNNSCQNFKAKFRPNGKVYTVHRRGAANEDIATAPLWSYAIPGVGSTICQVGRIAAPNFSGTNVPVYASVDVAYQLPNAFGAIETLTAQGTLIGTFYMATEGDVVIRTSDVCPVYKSPTTGSVATNRSVCGTSRYRWEWTPQNPSSGLPIALMGGFGASRTFALSQVPGVGLNQQYGVRIGTLHLDGLTTTPYGTSSCVKTIGFAGMDIESDSHIEPSSDAPFMLYPNPSINGHFTLIQQGTSEDELKSITMTDITGKVVYRSLVVMDANSVEVEFGDLASGVYVVMVGEERLRLVVQ